MEAPSVLVSQAGSFVYTSNSLVFLLLKNFAPEILLSLSTISSAYDSTTTPFLENKNIFFKSHRLPGVGGKEGMNRQNAGFLGQ